MSSPVGQEQPREVGDSDVEVPAYLQLLWNGEVSRPGPKRALDLREVAAAGIRLADAKGLSAVSMRAVASEIGFTPMALYRYVAKKDELVAMMVEEAFGPPPPPSPGDWRAKITDWAKQHRAVLRRHHWVTEVRFDEPPLTPQQLGWLEVGLDALAELGLKPQTALSSVLLVDVYVRGHSQLTMTDPNASPDADRRYAAQLNALIDPAALPRVAACFAPAALTDTDTVVDEFEFGLHTVLDGIAARAATTR